MGSRCEKAYGVSVGKYIGVWGRLGERYGGVEEDKERWGCVKKCEEMCEKVYGVSVGGAGKCVGVRV